MLLNELIEEYSVRNKSAIGYPVYSVTNSQGFCKDYFGKEVASKDKSTYKIVPYGYFAYNPSRINVGSIDWQHCEENVIVSPLYNVFKVNTNKIIQPYLQYYFKSRTVSVYINAFAKGTVRMNLSLATLGTFPIPLPPLETQSRIVSELDLLQSIIDKQQAQLKELDTLAQAIFYDMFGDPVENEKGWEVKKLGEITNKISDGVHAKPNYTETGMPFISVVNINRGKLIFDDCKYVSQIDGETFNKRTKPEKGDILYTKVGATYGISALVDVDIDFCLYVSVCLIKPKRELLDSLFLTHMMRLPYIKNQADERIRGIGVPDLHLNQISAFDVIVPPLSLQQTFAQKIESIERQKELINQSIREARALFDSRMEYYFGV